MTKIRGTAQSLMKDRLMAQLTYNSFVAASLTMRDELAALLTAMIDSLVAASFEGASKVEQKSVPSEKPKLPKPTRPKD